MKVEQIMKITQISVEGLFGIFNHVIPLNTDERITIIHGLNGFGKTNILRILNGIFNSRYSALKTIPFDSFKVEFDDNTILEVEKKVLESKKANAEIIFNLYCNNQKQETYHFKNTKIRSKDVSFPVSILDELIFEINRISADKWVYRPTEEILSLNEIIDRYEDFIPLRSQLKFRDTPPWLEELRESIAIRLVESQRLLNVDFEKSSRFRYSSSSMLPTVSEYSKEIAGFMQSKFAEYGAISQSLDRTFPVRAVKQPASDLTDKQLKKQLNELEKTRSRLVEIGLLDRDEDRDFYTQPEDINESARSILSVYVEDIKQKLDVFDEIANKIELLRTIINRKFTYSYKVMNFSKEHGFVFTTCYPNSSEMDSKNLSPTDLSSGEQHELVLLYELLFKVEPNSLVLIDEPELSLHVGWQSQFLKDLQEITELADLDILMATHSPDIILDRWDDLTVELKAPGK